MSDSKAQALWKQVRPGRDQFIGVGIVVAFVAMAMGCQALTEGGPDEGSAPGARDACEQFVDKRLKSPGSADYNLVATQDGTLWTVTGTVDSENSFGASLRSTVRCSLRYRVGSYRSLLVEVE